MISKSYFILIIYKSKLMWQSSKKLGHCFGIRISLVRIDVSECKWIKFAVKSVTVHELWVSEWVRVRVWGLVWTSLLWLIDPNLLLPDTLKTKKAPKEKTGYIYFSAVSSVQNILMSICFCHLIMNMKSTWTRKRSGEKLRQGYNKRQKSRTTNKTCWV